MQYEALNRGEWTRQRKWLQVSVEEMQELGWTHIVDRGCVFYMWWFCVAHKQNGIESIAIFDQITNLWLAFTVSVICL